jgi:hypothetical protein
VEVKPVGVEALPLFEQENDTAVPLRVRYAAWRATERAGEIVRYIESVAVNLFQGGAAHISINQLFESARARFGHTNNNWRSFVAREILGRHLELGAALKVRPLGRPKAG